MFSIGRVMWDVDLCVIAVVGGFWVHLCTNCKSLNPSLQFALVYQTYETSRLASVPCLCICSIRGFRVHAACMYCRPLNPSFRLGLVIRLVGPTG